MAISYEKKGDTYINSFLRKRLIPFYFKYIFFVILYAGLYLFLGESIELSQLLKSFFIGGTIVRFGWYFQTQLVLYIMFYSSYRQAANGLRTFSIGYLIVISICIVYDLGSQTWWVTTPLFLLGLIWGSFHDQFERIIKKYQLVVILGCLLWTVVMWKCADYIHGRHGELIKTISSSIFLSVAAIGVLARISVVGKVTGFLGRISLEIYAVQGMVYLIVDRMNIPYGLQFAVVLTITCVIALSVNILLSRCQEKISNIAIKIK